MPLRNERQAYWDDIEHHIVDVEALTGTAALSKLCPEAAAARDALRSRLDAVNDEMASMERQRALAMAHARVARNEHEARDFLAEKDARQKHAAAFVRGRLENDRPEVRRAAGEGFGRSAEKTTELLHHITRAQ